MLKLSIIRFSHFPAFIITNLILGWTPQNVKLLIYDIHNSLIYCHKSRKFTANSADL